MPRLITIFKNSDEDSVVHDRAAQALKEIGTEEAIASLNVTNSSPSTIDCGAFRLSHCGFDEPEAPLPDVRRSVQSITNSPLVCQIPGIKSILPRCQ